jgi:uncharacterized protein YjbI with pentapeptide repeats
MAFREEDADNFFGREAFIEQLLFDVNRKPLVSVIGASGSGKSSVVFAGLIPQLRRDENTQWRIISFRPGKNPFESLAVALMGSGEIGENQRYQELELEVELKRNISAFPRIIADMFGDGSRVLLVVDQFEEIYTLCPNVEERQIFIDGLLNVCVGEQFSTTVVMTLRVDFLGKAMSYQPLGKALQDFPPSLLVPMNRAELERAIIKPAARFSVELEEGLIDKLIDDVGLGEGSLPLQQFALTQLWGKQRPGLLTHKAYTEIGEVTQALANHAEAVYAGLSEEQQKRAQRVFIQLVQPGEGTEDTRRLATRDEVGDYWDLVTLLANERLLVTNRNQLVEDTVEVVHEALIRNWGRLRGWMDDNREMIQQKLKIEAAAKEWLEKGKVEDYLLEGQKLIDIENWLKVNVDLLPLSILAEQFIWLSIKEWRKSRVKYITSAVSFILMILILQFGAALGRFSEQTDINESLETIREIALDKSKVSKLKTQYEFIENIKQKKFTDQHMQRQFDAFENLVRKKVSLNNLFIPKEAGIQFVGINFKNAKLYQIEWEYKNFSGAYLYKAYLARANISYAKLNGTFLHSADLTEANLANSDFKGASLYNANINGANFKGAKNLTIEQVKSAKNWRTARYDNNFRAKLGLLVE